MPPIAIISDFGVKDWFVGELKGVLYSISPDTTIIDITHDVSPGDIRAAAFILLASYESFPPDTIFCVAVGISSETNCRSIAARTPNHIFIGPDNGVLSWVLNKNKYQLRCIEKDAYIRHHPSSTFQARDIFGPAAAHVSLGVSLAQLGPEISDIVKIPFPQPSINISKITGEVIYIDRFGNALTNVQHSHLQSLQRTCSSCILNDKYTIYIKKQYQDVDHLEKLCYPGSAGYMEIAVRGANAASILEISVGQKVEIG